MSINVEEIKMKTPMYYFFNDIIYIENFDLINIKIDEKSYKVFLFTILDI